MIVDDCTFTTARLEVFGWHALPGRPTGAPSLTELVIGLLSEPVTRFLPAGWRGIDDADRAARWIAERDAEGATLLVVDRATGDPLGLLLLHSADAGGDRVEVRIGYLLAESAWGRGLATELVTGLVAWCRARPVIGSIVGGVAPGNEASIRVLERCGFEPLSPPDTTEPDTTEPETTGLDGTELVFRLVLEAGPPSGPAPVRG